MLLIRISQTNVTISGEMQVLQLLLGLKDAGSINIKIPAISMKFLSTVRVQFPAIFLTNVMILILQKNPSALSIIKIRSGLPPIDWVSRIDSHQLESSATLISPNYQLSHGLEDAKFIKEMMLAILMSLIPRVPSLGLVILSWSPISASLLSRLQRLVLSTAQLEAASNSSLTFFRWVPLWS